MSDYVKKIHPRTRSMNLKLSPFLKEKPIVYTNSKFLSIPPCVRIFGPGVVHSQKPPYYQRKKKIHDFSRLGKPSTPAAATEHGRRAENAWCLGDPRDEKHPYFPKVHPKSDDFFNVEKLSRKKKKTSQPTLTMIGKFSANSMMTWGRDCGRFIWVLHNQIHNFHVTQMCPFQLLHSKVSKIDDSFGMTNH